MAALRFLENVSLLGRAAPAIDNGIGVAAFASGDVMAFRPENGSILWTESLGGTRMNDAGAEINDIRARPVIDADKVFVVSSGGLLSALDLKRAASSGNAKSAALTSLGWPATFYILFRLTPN